MTQSKSMQALWQDSFLEAGNEGYLEDIYETYLSDPQQVTPEWRAFFDNLLQTSDRTSADVSHIAVREQFLQLAKQSAQKLVPEGFDTAQSRTQERVLEMISAFRSQGHLQANIDPLGLYKGMEADILSLDYYGFTEQDLKQTFSVGNFAGLNKDKATLAEIYQGLQKVYCQTIGFEFMHINRVEEVEWIRERIEQNWANFKPSDDEKKYLLQRLVAADGLEKYLGFKYVGQKRFSLEGCDTLIPFLDATINRTAENGVKEIIIGMAHRGRLNVLLNIVGKKPADIFAGFEGKGISTTHSGDVKYHLGCSSDVNTPSGPMHIALAFNPSHLEIVAPVAQGSVRARQRRRCDKEQREVIPIQIHGDAAFAGQGVVMETFNMSQARWFKVGGSIHIVVNNQVGFTISNVQDARSTTYCTDVAKMVEPPILHVNANDVEAVYFAALFASDYRQTFKRDVVIDLVGYRRHGHNEADEPAATQPIMYQIIKAMPVAYQIYTDKLVKEGIIKSDWPKQLVAEYRDALDAGKIVVDLNKDKNAYAYTVHWEPYLGQSWREPIVTAVPPARIKKIGEALARLPEGFVLQPQVKKTLDARIKMTEGEVPMNWGYAETMAYATLLDEGYPIRLCGQDAARGTFAHRHAVLHDQNNDEIYIPLSHISPNQAQINLVDSLLSEEAVLAFEYGYATAEPKFLVLWEAQYGDFANGAQVVIDQFISSGEQKWGRLCGLVMLLPHGYEGGGPEHSSARLERYLQLCAQDNMQVCVPTTPAQMFHLLRRQMLRPYRKPLIVMTPKNLLRNPLAVSPLSALSEGNFHLVIPEVDDIAKQPNRVIFCCGKIYYELWEARQKQQANNIALVRIEQLYPFPEEEVKAILQQYKECKDIVWCQEEPENQGAWIKLQPYFLEILYPEQRLRYVGRPASASPAVGYHSVHEKEQKELIKRALT